MALNSYMHYCLTVPEIFGPELMANSVIIQKLYPSVSTIILWSFQIYIKYKQYRFSHII